MALPYPDIDDVPAPGNVLYPTLINITTADLVGPSAANRQHLEIEIRTDTLRDRVNKLIGNTDYLTTVLFGLLRPTDATFLFRDGTLAMAGNLNMAGYKISALVMTDPAGTSSEAANKSYVDAAVAVVGNYVLKAGDTMSGNLVMANSQAFMGKDTGATARYLAYVNALNVAVFGDAALPMSLVTVGGAFLTAGVVGASVRITGLAPLQYGTGLPLLEETGAPPATRNGISMGSTLGGNVITVGDGNNPLGLYGNGIYANNSIYLTGTLYGWAGSNARRIAAIENLGGGSYRWAAGDTALTTRPVLCTPAADLNLDLYDGTSTAKVWHALNDGSGSTLDADLLDTYHASSLAPSRSLLTSSGTYNVPDTHDYYRVTIRMIGGGGSGGGSNDSEGAGGGGSGCFKEITLRLPKEAYFTYSCGTGGPVTGASRTPGNAGDPTSVDLYLDGTAGSCITFRVKGGQGGKQGGDTTEPVPQSDGFQTRTYREGGTPEAAWRESQFDGGGGDNISAPGSNTETGGHGGWSPWHPGGIGADGTNAATVGQYGSGGGGGAENSHEGAAGGNGCIEVILEPIL
jgi:hypothetical protein